MAKRTVLFIFILCILTTLLFGFNLGKKFNSNPAITPSELSPTPNLQPTIYNPSPTIDLQPTITDSQSSIAPEIVSNSGKSTYADKTCGFSVVFPSSSITTQTNNGSTIISFPDRPAETIVTACLPEIPRPPLPPEKVETIKIGGISAFLYHDASAKDGTPRDEVIVRHPSNGKEIIIAGYGKLFEAAIASFKFI